MYVCISSRKHSHVEELHFRILLSVCCVLTVIKNVKRQSTNLAQRTNAELHKESVESVVFVFFLSFFICLARRFYSVLQLTNLKYYKRLQAFNLLSG